MATAAVKRAAIQALLWGGWTVLSLVLYGDAMLKSNSGLALLILCMVGAGCWVASEALRAWALHGRWLDLPPWRLLGRVVAAPVLLAVLVQGVVALVIWGALTAGWVSTGSVKAPGLLARAAYVMNTAILLWLWLLGWGAAQYARRWRQGEIARWQAEAARRALELDVLRAQVNPHFLFNALNNLRALIGEDPARAREMVSRMSAVLRHTLTHSARERVPLADELAVARDYLAIEAVHLEERLRVEWQVAAGLDGAQVPPMVLQLMVENAVKHGVARTPGGGLITVAIAPTGPAGKQLRMAVTNPGRFAPSPDRPGLGMAHLRERLARAGGAGARCEIEDRDQQVTIALTLTP